MTHSDQTQRKYLRWVTCTSLIDTFLIASTLYSLLSQGTQIKLVSHHKMFLCDPTAINGSEGRRNNNIIMPSCKKLEMMLHQVCQPGDKQPNSKMLVPRMAFGSIRAMMCCAVLTRISKTYLVVLLCSSLPSTAAPASLRLIASLTL